MNWDDLKYLIAVSEKGSLKAAAAHLGVNHTTAWRKMQNLEKQLRSQLFVVDRRGYLLTDMGSLILDSARKIGIINHIFRRTVMYGGY
jgi:DNA-binding transcriptional LysR family regulator